MIVILKKNAESQQVELFTAWLHNMGLETHLSVGENHTIVGLVGDTSRVDIESILRAEGELAGLVPAPALPLEDADPEGGIKQDGQL